MARSEENYTWYNKAQEEIKRMLDLLKLEQEEDRKVFKLRSAQRTIQERVNFGLTWYPVKIVKEEIGWAAQPVCLPAPARTNPFPV